MQQRIQEAKVAQLEVLKDTGGAQGQEQTQAKPPSESISFKDLPPEGKVQMAQQAGIQLNPQQVSQYEQNQQQVAFKAAKAKGANDKGRNS